MVIDKFEISPNLTAYTYDDGAFELVRNEHDDVRIALEPTETDKLFTWLVTGQKT